MRKGEGGGGEGEDSAVPLSGNTTSPCCVVRPTKSPFLSFVGVRSMFARRSEVQPLVAPAARSCCLKPATCVALTAGISGICFGYEIGIVDSVLSMDSFRTFFGTSAMVDGGIIEPTGSASSVEGSIVSLFLCGCCLGSVGASYCADAFGRKACLVIGSLLFTLGGICQALSNSLALLYFGRLLAGCGIGALSMVAPLFISETSSKQSRGVLISTQQLLITVGIFLASCINSVRGSRTAASAKWAVLRL